MEKSNEIHPKSIRRLLSFCGPGLRAMSTHFNGSFVCCFFPLWQFNGNIKRKSRRCECDGMCVIVAEMWKSGVIEVCVWTWKKSHLDYGIRYNASDSNGTQRVRLETPKMRKLQYENEVKYLAMMQQKNVSLECDQPLIKI